VRQIITALLGATALSIASVPGALAADMPVKAPVAIAAYNWTGCHLGANVGGKWATTSGSVDIGAGTTPIATPPESFGLAKQTATSFIGGGQTGCDYQSGKFVYGIEGDFDGQNISVTRGVPAVVPSFIPGDTFDVRSRWQASLRGRIGYAWDRTLLYATGGVAFTDVEVGTNFITSSLPGAVASDHQILIGATFGGGIEYAFLNNVSFGVEGRYTWYGTHTFNNGLLAQGSLGANITYAPLTTTLKLDTAEVIFKANYRFSTH
jgi:outer membrane immunogenic protein